MVNNLPSIMASRGKKRCWSTLAGQGTRVNGGGAKVLGREQPKKKGRRKQQNSFHIPGLEMGRISVGLKATATSLHGQWWYVKMHQKGR